MNLYSKDTTKTESNDNGSAYNVWDNGQPHTLHEGELIGTTILKGNLAIESFKNVWLPFGHSFLFQAFSLKK